MKTYFNFYHLLLIIPVLILYSNCDSFQSTDSSQASLANCANSASLSLEKLNFFPNTDCNNIDLIHCERRRFSPDVVSGTESMEDCLSDSPYGDVCLTLMDRSYSTLGASNNSEDYLEGGPYNYHEVNCYMERFSQNGKPIFQSTTHSLESSLIALHDLCESAGR